MRLTLCAMNELVRVSHGLWRAGTDIAELRGLCAAVLDVMPAGAVLAGRTAAALHALWLPASEVVRVEVILSRPGILPRALAHSQRAEVRARRRSLRDSEKTMVDGLPAVTAERAWIDLAEELSLPDLVACGDSVLRGSTRSAIGLDVMVGRAAGRRGVRRAREAFDLLDARSRSRPESHLRVALVTGGLPWPEVNQPIFDDNHQWVAEPDLHYEVPRVALEYQGAMHAQLERMHRDITRGIDVVGNDWLSVPFGPTEVFKRPWSIAPLVRALIERRAPGWLREWREMHRVARNIAPLAG